MKKIHRQIIIIGLAIFIGLIYFVLFFQIANSQGIAWGVKVANLKLSQKDIAASKEILENKWHEFTSQEITLLYQEKSWSIKLVDLGLELNCQATVNLAYQIGRRSNIFINIKEQLLALFGYYNLEPICQINQEKFQEKTTELFKNIEKPAKNATLVFNQEIDDFSLVHSTKGTTINREKLLSDLKNQAKAFSKQPIQLELIFDKPAVANEEVSLAKDKAQQILAEEPYQLAFEGRYWRINKKRLIDWIKFEPIFDENDNPILGLFIDKGKVTDYLLKISYAINRPATNAQIVTDENRAIVFIANQESANMKINETIEQLIENILADPSIKTTNILASQSAPQITLEQTNELGINSLIGQGTSNFAGSPNNRIHNIKTGAAKFNGLILAPDEEFSFNNLLGGSGPEEGFLPELVIKKNKTVPEYGGGLCQVSTTMFRAAINSGLKITERVPHAFPVEYYYPQGFDATVYEPSPDIKFINNTLAHLLIEAVIEGTYLSFNFYATDDNRDIKILGPYVLEKKEDGSMKTVLTQEIYKDGELIDKQVFYSNYQSPDLFPVEIAQTEE